MFKKFVTGSVFVALIAAVTGLLYWALFSPSFYSYAMLHCEVCRG